MVTGPVQQSSAVPRADLPYAVPRQSPSGELHALRWALAGTPTDPRWRARLAMRLHPVRQGFVDHVRLTEGPTGRYAALVADAPRLARPVRLLTGEHAAIIAALAALQRAVDRAETSAEELRHRADELLAALYLHRQRGADLLWQAYQTDLGGET